MISRRSLLALCPAWLLALLPFRKTKAAVTSFPVKYEPLGAPTYVPDKAFWDYIRLARPLVHDFLQKTMPQAFKLRQGPKRFMLSLPINRDDIPFNVLKELDQQVNSDDLAMVFAGTPRIFSAGPAGRTDIGFDVGDVFCLNPGMFDSALPNKVMPCRITRREAFTIWLLFSDGTKMQIDVDDVRVWGGG